MKVRSVSRAVACCLIPVAATAGFDIGACDRLQHLIGSCP
jgi:hypothetical protein